MSGNKGLSDIRGTGGIRGIGGTRGIISTMDKKGMRDMMNTACIRSSRSVRFIRGKMIYVIYF